MKNSEPLQADGKGHHLKVVSLLEPIHLIEPTILFFLSPYVLSDRLLIHANGGNKIPPGPEMLPRKVLPLSQVHSRNLDGALPLEKPYHLRNPILGRNRHQHVHRVGLQMPFYDLTLLLKGMVLEPWPKLSP
jgi:hypothetical protein